MEILLATLLIRAEQVVPSSQLLGELWGDGLPEHAYAGLYVYISQLRKFLKRPGVRESPVVTRSPGYLLHLGKDEFDFQLFRTAMNDGRRQLREGCPLQAVAEFEKALALWRGPALGSLCGGPVLDGFAAWLAESRLECLELLTEAKLVVGQHREVVSLLHALVAEHPQREAYYKQLMVALYRSDRRAEALSVYQQARGVFVAELGLEPCQALRDLHQAIILEDSALKEFATRLV